ncbi:DUF4136 domain-containing protein [Thalassotalea maritima]|uniref:DUF4136 domain-containing protein n=1 Tax=Thalassotalea maritima TaxID=3242416 RepID=UPI003529976E
MMKRVLMILALTIFLVSCATSYKPDVDYKLDYDFSAVNSFAILDHTLTETAKVDQLSSSVSSLDYDRIAYAIRATLLDKGMQETSEDLADTLVRFKLITKEKQEIRTYNTGFHHCWYCDPFYDRPFGMRQEVKVRNYTEGTLIIDMMDPSTKKSIWRSVVSQAVRKNVPVVERQARIRTLVTTMLADFKRPTESQP